MNPINAINQEFTRVVVQEWSEQENARESIQQAPAVSFRRSVQAVIAWVLVRMARPIDAGAAYQEQRGASQ